MFFGMFHKYEGNNVSNVINMREGARIFTDPPTLSVDKGFRWKKFRPNPWCINYIFSSYTLLFRILFSSYFSPWKIFPCYTFQVVVYNHDCLIELFNF